MQHSQKKLLAAVALIVATLSISSAYAGKTFHQTSGGTTSVPVSDEWKPDKFELQIRDGKAVAGMTGVKKDGARITLKQGKPTCATSCPAGQSLSCWEDEEQMMSICVCYTPGGGGSVLNRRVGSIVPY